MIELQRLNSVSVMTSNVGSTHMTPREDHVRLSDALTYGDQRAAEAREQMRGELKTVKKHALNGVDLPCIECGIVGCNGECSGDGAMGD